MNMSGFLECVFCGSNRLGLCGIDEEGQQEVPPAAVVIIECLACDHRFAVDISQATEQVHLGFYGMACPDGCPDQAQHQER